MSRSPNNIRDQLSDALRRLAAVEGRQEDFQATVDILDSDVNRALEGIHDLLREQTQNSESRRIIRLIIRLMGAQREASTAARDPRLRSPTPRRSRSPLNRAVVEPTAFGVDENAGSIRRAPRPDRGRRALADITSTMNVPPAMAEVLEQQPAAAAAVEMGVDENVAPDAVVQPLAAVDDDAEIEVLEPPAVEENFAGVVEQNDGVAAVNPADIPLWEPLQIVILTTQTEPEAPEIPTCAVCKEQQHVGLHMFRGGRLPHMVRQESDRPCGQVCVCFQCASNWMRVSGPLPGLRGFPCPACGTTVDFMVPHRI